MCRHGTKAQRHVHLHFTPTSASGLNLVERLFAGSTDKAIQRGVCKRVRALQGAIEACLAVPNADPHPYTWMAYGGGHDREDPRESRSSAEDTQCHQGLFRASKRASPPRRQTVCC